MFKKTVDTGVNSCIMLLSDRAYPVALPQRGTVGSTNMHRFDSFYGSSRVDRADSARFYKRLGEMEALRAPPAAP